MTFHIRRSLATLGAVSTLAATVAAMPAAAAASPSHTSSKGAAEPYEVRLIRLACQRTEDSTGADEAYLTFNGYRIWGVTKINNGQVRGLGIVKTFTSVANVSLFDEDSPDADDFLGTVVIRSREANRGPRYQHFTRDGAHYTIYYRVDSARSEN